MVDQALKQPHPVRIVKAHKKAISTQRKASGKHMNFHYIYSTDGTCM